MFGDLTIPHMRPHFDVGDVVWAQARGLPSWPGKIVDESKVGKGKPDDGKGPNPLGTSPLGGPNPPGTPPLEGPNPPGTSPLKGPNPLGTSPLGGPNPPGTPPLEGPNPPGTSPLKGPNPPGTSPLKGPNPLGTSPLGGPNPSVHTPGGPNTPGTPSLGGPNPPGTPPLGGPNPSAEVVNINTDTLIQHYHHGNGKRQIKQQIKTAKKNKGYHQNRMTSRNKYKKFKYKSSHSNLCGTGWQERYARLHRNILASRQEASKFDYENT
ncbi:hypothetical protein QZH41_004404 [Actinostola sp. cb2023]|nr:hypothetical protein QZH41_004404 [Actinostola sp. cb2023]